MDNLGRLRKATTAAPAAAAHKRAADSVISMVHVQKVICTGVAFCVPAIIKQRRIRKLIKIDT
jgi:hypothetical protein